MRASENPALIKAFAAEIKGRRAALKISQEELALICGVNRTYIAKLELAQSQPTLSVLLKIAEGLDVGLVELVQSSLVRYKTELKTQRRMKSAED